MSADRIMIITPKESKLENIRERIWEYPSFLFDRDGLLPNIVSIYSSLRPISHIIVFLIFGLLLFSNFVQGEEHLFQSQRRILYEGVVVGESTLSRINPLVPTNNQLEKDITSLLYEPLIRVNSEGEVIGILAESWEKLDDDGKDFKFTLRKDVSWHDGEKFNSDDVMTTFNYLKAFSDDDSSPLASKVIELMRHTTILQLDEHTVEFKLEEITPTFFEDISVGIMPAHVLEKVNYSAFSYAEFNLSPIGTGAFEFTGIDGNVIFLKAFVDYYKGVANIGELRITMFDNADDAVDALKNGQIHLLADPSSSMVDEIEGYPNLLGIDSISLYRRSIGMYFNLRDTGPEIFKDKEVRQAISSAISRSGIVEAVHSASEEALGPIAKNSWAYNEDATRYRYDKKKVKILLKKAGWKEKKIEDTVVRMKGDETLRFELSYLDKSERIIVAESIKKDLAEVGIIVNLNPVNSRDLNEALIATRNFEAVLYGVETSVDPDRIRLWHSKAIDYPGLNISSYATKQTGAILGDDQNIERVSLIDASLENGIRSLDRKQRNGSAGLSIGYQKFQEIIMEECPVVYLYHPKFSYIVHSRVEGIDLSMMEIPEDRYLSVMEWEIR